ncbi:MAG: VTT domain-containing protein [Anaerolineaceae bacterium]
MNDDAPTKKRKNLLTIILLVVGLAILFFLVSRFSEEMDVVGNFIRRAGWLGWVISILIFGLFGATPIPSEPVTVLITTIYGPAPAAIITALGNVLAAVVEFFIGHRVGGIADFNKLKEKLPFGLSKVPVDSPIFLITARMLPGYGPKFISIISGIYKVPFLRYLWTTAVATSIGALVVSFGGYGILSLILPK